MIVLVVSPLCLGDGPIVTTNEVLAVPAELGASKIIIMDIYDIKAACIHGSDQKEFNGPKSKRSKEYTRVSNFSILSQSAMH